MKPKVERQKQCTDENLDKSLIYKTNFYQIKNSGFSPRSVLDIGAQEGQFANKLMKEFGVLSATCLELEKDAVSQGKKRFPDIKWYQADIRKFNFDQEYDLVLLLNLHFYFTKEERISILKNINSHLSKNGRLLVSFGDINFTARGTSPEEAIAEISDILSLDSIIKVFDVQAEQKDYHLMANRWYTSVLVRRK